MSLCNYIEEQLHKLGIEVNSETLEQLCDYIKDLVKWGRVHNLSGADSAEELVDRLVLDIASVLFQIDFICKLSRLIAPSIIDIGSGNGSPGIVWAICNENISLKFVEKSRKKSAFLNSLTGTLKLSSRVKVHNQRIEDCFPFAGSNIITCKAFMDIENFLNITHRFAKMHAYWVLMTTRKLSQGLSDKFLEKKGIIRVSDLDSSVKILDRNYERNFLNKKVLLLKKHLRINFVACLHDKHTFSCESKRRGGQNHYCCKHFCCPFWVRKKSVIG